MHYVYAVETQNLIKRYGKTQALKGLDFSVDQGEIMVLLGPNGSGKSTLLLILSTILKPTSGIARVMGLDVTKQPTRIRQILGISFQEARGFWRHKPAEILQFHAAICGVPKNERKTRIEAIMKGLELWDARNKLFMHLSGGQTKRLEVSKLLLSRPKFAIFDEPSSQVDLRGKRKIWAEIHKLRELIKEKVMKNTGLVLCLLAILLFGCGEANQSQPAKTPITAENFQTIAGMQWTLQQMTLKGKEYPLVGEKPFIQFVDDSKVNGFASINRFFGSFKVDEDGHVSWPGPFGSTRMAGPQDLMDQEDAFLKALPQTDRLSKDGMYLHASNEDEKIKLIFYVPVE
jgi:ABC-type Na+ transport system ATPase subunit NatA/heat shock protein HslJ